MGFSSNDAPRRYPASVENTRVSAVYKVFRNVETLLTWQRRAHEQDRLATFDPRLLSDMGISEAAAAREAAIPFWWLK